LLKKYMKCNSIAFIPWMIPISVVEDIVCLVNLVPIADKITMTSNTYLSRLSRTLNSTSNRINDFDLNVIYWTADWLEFMFVWVVYWCLTHNRRAFSRSVRYLNIDYISIAYIIKTLKTDQNVLKTCHFWINLFYEWWRTGSSGHNTWFNIILDYILIKHK